MAPDLREGTTGVLTGTARSRTILPVSTLAVVAARLLLQADACPATNPSCASRPSAVVRKPIFEGFGIHEFLIIGSAAAATLIGLIVVAWLLVHLTGAHRDYATPQVQGVGHGGDDSRSMGPEWATSSFGSGPRRPRPQISTSTWVGVTLVFVLAVGVASWIALSGNDGNTAAPSTTTVRSSSSSAGATVAVATTGAPLPPGCTKPAFNAAFLPAGFTNQLVAGYGAPTASDPGCAFHWQGPDRVISLLTTGYSPLGPPGNVQVTTKSNGRTMYVGPTPDGGLGLVIEEKELGGAPDIWFTLMSTTVARNDLIETAANLQRA